MCLAIPMKLTEVLADGTAVADLDGSRRHIDVSLLGDPRAGDYVIVHAGFAIEKLDEAEANERLALFDELIGGRSDPATGSG
jgi:hydrogenase expression/formation protein HypC